MKYAIYTISKNEEHNVAAFMAAAEGADVYVLDTGSTDNTVSLLKKHGAHVKEKQITPWRFDAARNEALSMLPDDVEACVSLDMDEVIEPGWQEKLIKQWKGNIGNYLYIPEWADKEKTKPLVVCNRTRLHSRKEFFWGRKIHEILKPKESVQQVLFNTDILVRHYQNDKQRHYCYALDELIKENPEDLNARIQRAAEMYQKKEWSKALEDYLFYVHKQIANNEPDIRYKKSICWLSIAYCYYFLNDIDSCYRSFLFSIAEEPAAREPWVHLAHLLSQTNNVPLAYGAAMTAANIKTAKHYMAKEESAWSDFPETLAKECFNKLIKDK